jgi:peptidyl-prolyl cis-trans isomerase A (cyclophilin A)
MMHAQFTTTEGSFKIRLFDTEVPNTVANFVGLAEGTKEFVDPKTGQKTSRRFYDGLVFHRVIPNFMAQGGDPQGVGMGGPGYKYEGEFSDAAKHDKPGILSMANAGPGTDGSQFFLTFVPTPHLNGKHTVFGEVTEGQDVLKKLEQAGSQSGKTSEPLSITKATIEVK